MVDILNTRSITQLIRWVVVVNKVVQYYTLTNITSLLSTKNLTITTLSYNIQYKFLIKIGLGIEAIRLFIISCYFITKKFSHLSFVFLCFDHESSCYLSKGGHFLRASPIQNAINCTPSRCTPLTWIKMAGSNKGVTYTSGGPISILTFELPLEKEGCSQKNKKDLAI